MADIAERMPENRPEKWPLSAAQKGIWLGQQLSPQSPLYNTAECVEISGCLDPEVFERSLRQMVTEAETLNLRFDIEKAEPVQSVEANLNWALPFLDLRSKADSRQAAWDWMKQNLSQRANLRTGELFAQALIQIAPDRYLWYQRIHHIAIDGYGYSLLGRRVADIYTALVQGQAVPPSPFASLRAVLAEDIAYQASEQKQRDRTYWLKALAAAPAPVSLSSKTSPASALCLHQSSTLPPEVFAHLQTVARQTQASWPDILLAVTAIYLYQVTGAAALIIGLPLMGRLGSAALRVPTMVMNIVPLRVSVRPDSCFSDLVKQIRQRLLAMRP
ncbi:MAG: condensation domain-containing protein, partial [Phormidesmis sp.]